MRHSFALVLLGCFASPGSAQQGLRLPAGFEATEYADSKLANDIWSMTIDPQGRVVVSGPGYIRILVEDPRTGRANAALDIHPAPKEGAHSLFWEGDHLYFTADGGLRRYRMVGNRAAGPSQLIRAMKTGGEHAAHAIRRGPDGWLYLLCGNNTGIDKSYATLPTSPIKEPIAGCVLRFTPDLKDSEIVAHGFRNPYDFDFNLDGELFTYDSDNERCVSLPWYEFTRFYHVIPGGHHGWQSPQRGQFFRLPPYFPDVVPSLCYLGRGSPTGVACYRHVQFPEKYRGNFFLADWTFGRLYFISLKRFGLTYTAEKEVFLQATGDNGFAPTALAVHPRTGDLFVAIGGRGTRGAVYRIRYPAGSKIDSRKLAKMQVKPRSLEWQDSLASAGPDRQSLSALYRHRHRLKSDLLREVVEHNWDVDGSHNEKVLADLIAALEPGDRMLLARQAATNRQRLIWLGGSCETDPDRVITDAGRILGHPDTSMNHRLWAVRLIQMALGNLTSRKMHGTVWEGYSPRREYLDPAQVRAALTSLRSALAHPASRRSSDLDREICRSLAMLQDDDPAIVLWVAEKLTASSHPVEDIHYLIVLARLKGPLPDAVRRSVAAALLTLDQRIAQLNLTRDRHWPLRIAELHAELARKDPNLNAAIIGHAEFGRPDHALFARCPGFDRKRAARIFLDRAAKVRDFAWNADIVALLGELPPAESFPVLRKLWGEAGLEESILPVLAKSPDPADREKFLHGLASPQPATVRISLQALETMPPSPLPQGERGKEVLSLILTLRRLGDTKDEKQLAQWLGQYLGKLTGQDKLGGDKNSWTEWFSKTYPQLAARLGGPDGVDVPAWHKRFARIDWDRGEAERGSKVFIKANCASCHSGGQALGPDLRGVASRFSRSDLLTAIIQPSKDITNRYRTVQVETVDGKLYQGLVIYEAVDSLILQTGPTDTIRLDGSQVAGVRPTDVSLMPAGLLDMLADDEIADLYAYLRSLGEAVQR